jgi:hypothetical protein
MLQTRNFKEKKKETEERIWREIYRLKEEVECSERELHNAQEEGMYPLLLFMYYSDECVSQMCLVRNSLN